MARLPDIDLNNADKYSVRIAEARAEVYGQILGPDLVYGRRPKLFKAARTMSGTLDGSDLLDEAFSTLIQPARGQAQRLPFLTGHQRCRGQQVGAVGGQDLGPGRLCAQ